MRWAVGDLRQHATDQSDDVYVLLRGGPADGVGRGTWHATVPEVEGLFAGTVELPVAHEPVDIDAVPSVRRTKS